MATPAILVFEKQPRWAPELQRQFAGEEVHVRACRATADMGALLSGRDSGPARESRAAAGRSAGPSSPTGRAPFGAENVGNAVVVLDLDAGPADCLQFLGRWIGRLPAVVVIASPQSAELEWPVRELGTLSFLTDYVSGEDLAHLCRRHLSR